MAASGHGGEYTQPFWRTLLIAKLGSPGMPSQLKGGEINGRIKRRLRFRRTISTSNGPLGWTEENSPKTKMSEIIPAAEMKFLRGRVSLIRHRRSWGSKWVVIVIAHRFRYSIPELSTLSDRSFSPLASRFYENLTVFHHHLSLPSSVHTSARPPSRWFRNQSKLMIKVQSSVISIVIFTSWNHGKDVANDAFLGHRPSLHAHSASIFYAINRSLTC